MHCQLGLHLNSCACLVARKDLGARMLPDKTRVPWSKHDVGHTPCQLGHAQSHHTWMVYTIPLHGRFIIGFNTLKKGYGAPSHLGDPYATM